MGPKKVATTHLNLHQVVLLNVSKTEQHGGRHDIFQLVKVPSGIAIGIGTFCVFWSLYL